MPALPVEYGVYLYIGLLFRVPKGSSLEVQEGVMLFLPLGVRVCMYIYIYIYVYRGVSHV